MRLSKSQLAVITILNVVIAILVATIFLMPAVSASSGDGSSGGGQSVGGEDPDPPEEIHNKFRDPSTGRVPEIVRETRLMGTGDETVVAVYFINGTSYIFGNATVADLDFDSYGGFLCMVGDSGSITHFTYLEGRLTAVGMVEGGFAAATLFGAESDEISRLYFVGYDGEASRVAVLDGAAVDIMPIDTLKTAVVTKPNDNSFKLTEYAVAGSALWAAEHNTRISSGYTLDYFDCFRLGDGYILAARAYSLPRYDSIVFYTFQAGGDASAHFYGGSGESMMQPYAVMPYPNGFLALCRRDGVAAVVTIDYAFMSYRRDLLGFAFTGARLVYSEGNYYACFEHADGITVYELDDLLGRKTVSAASGMLLHCAVKSDGTLLAGLCNEKARLTDVSGSRVLNLDIKDCVLYGGYRSGELTVIVLSASGGGAVSEPSGGKDVYIIAVRI